MFLIKFRVSPELEFRYLRYNFYLSERGYSELYHLLQRSPKRDGYGKTFGHRAVPVHKNVGDSQCLCKRGKTKSLL